MNAGAVPGTNPVSGGRLRAVRSTEWVCWLCKDTTCTKFVQGIGRRLEI